MKKIIFFAIIFYLKTFLSFAEENSQGHHIVAKIDNKAITRSELFDRYQFVLKISKIKAQNQEDKNLLLEQILDKMIDEELIRKEAKRLEISVSDDELNNAVNQISAKQNQSVESFKKSLLQSNIPYETYLKQTEAEILWSKIISALMKPKINVTESEIKELFEQKKYDINVRSFLIAEVLLSNSNPSSDLSKLAEKLFVELKNGANFADIVRQFSSGYNVNNNGEIGWVSSSDISKEIYEAISKIKVGQYTPPILLADGYHIFKLIDKKTKVKIQDQDFKAAKSIIFSRKIETMAKGYLIDLRRNSFIEVKIK